jgi:hypothetical protein
MIIVLLNARMTDMMDPQVLKVLQSTYVLHVHFPRLGRGRHLG